MSIPYLLWQLLSVVIAGHLGDEQQRMIGYPPEEHRVLARQIGKKRLRLTDDQRNRFWGQSEDSRAQAAGRDLCDRGVRDDPALAPHSDCQDVPRKQETWSRVARVQLGDLKPGEEYGHPAEQRSSSRGHGMRWSGCSPRSPLRPAACRPPRCRVTGDLDRTGSARRLCAWTTRALACCRPILRRPPESCDSRSRRLLSDMFS